MPLHCDVAIIGAGTAGLAAHEAATAEGAAAVLIEAGQGGTTCAATGCMPSKLLVAAASAAEAARNLDVFGLSLDGELRIDGAAVLGRVRRERDRFVAGVLSSVAEISAAQRLRGHARFTGPTTLEVTGAGRIEARAVVIATGARSTIPKPLRDLGDLLLTNESVFELPDLPHSLAVIGAGPLGLELGQAFARLGVRVAIFDEGDVIAGIDDPPAHAAALDALGSDVPIHLNASVSGRRVEGGAELSWNGEESGSEVFARVLVAAGRSPNLDGLGLEAAGLERDEHGTPLFEPETLRCGDSAVFIAGDANHARPVLHEASHEGMIAGRNAARFPNVAPQRRHVPFSIVYTDPEIAIIGAPLSQIEGDPAVAAVDLGQSGRARVMGRNVGLIRLHAGRDGKLGGGTIVGPEAEHLGHLVAFMVERGLTAEEALALPYYHPTLEESLRAALRQLCGQLRTRTEAPVGSMEFGPAP